MWFGQSIPGSSPAPLSRCCVQTPHELCAVTWLVLQMYDVWSAAMYFREWMDACELWQDTLADAFRWAHEVDPTAQLCINE